MAVGRFTMTEAQEHIDWQPHGLNAPLTIAAIDACRTS
jgi:hypothetical protein